METDHKTAAVEITKCEYCDKELSLSVEISRVDPGFNLKVTCFGWPRHQPINFGLINVHFDSCSPSLGQLYLPRNRPYRTAAQTRPVLGNPKGLVRRRACCLCMSL